MPKSRIDNLTCARFVAALLVLFHHASTEYPMQYFAQNFFYNGYIGVTFFFILSGFVIAGSSYDEMQQPSATGIFHFYARRVARIVPLWFFVSLPLLAPYLFSWPYGTSLWRYLTFTQAWSADVSVAYSFIALSWTLSCEFFFYLVFPLLAFILGKTLPRWPMTLFIFIAIAVLVPWVAAEWFAIDPVRSTLPEPDGAHHWLYRFPLIRLCEFAFGIGLQLMLRRYADVWMRAQWRMPWRALALLGIGSVLVLMVMTSAGPLTWTATYILPFGLVVLALAVLEPQKRRQTAVFALFVLLGEASYAFYLIHDVYVLQRPLFAAKTWLSLIWSACYAAAISVGLFTLIETPMRKLITNWLGERRPSEMSPAIREELIELQKT